MAWVWFGVACGQLALLGVLMQQVRLLRNRLAWSEQHAPRLDDELSLDNDGDVAIDWATPGGDMLSISVGPSGTAPMAWILNGKSGSATLQVPPQVFGVLRKIAA